MEAMGTGINGLQVASCGIFFEIPEDAALFNQCLSRLERTGQKNKFLSFYVLVAFATSGA